MAGVSMFAVIKTGGKQYKVAANDILKIEKLESEAGDVVTFDQVLMVGNGDDITIGAPLVAGAIVAGQLIETKKQKTIIVFKKERRHNYRRRNGHRQTLSTVRITEILTGGAAVTTQPDAWVKARLAAAQASSTSVSVSEAAPAPVSAPVAAASAKVAKPKAAPKPKAEAAAPVEAAAEAKPAKVKKPAAKKAAPPADQE
jgi:large subunit ribosomal protein L21